MVFFSAALLLVLIERLFSGLQECYRFVDDAQTNDGSKWISQISNLPDPIQRPRGLPSSIFPSPAHYFH